MRMKEIFVASITFKTPFSMGFEKGVLNIFKENKNFISMNEMGQNIRFWTVNYPSLSATRLQHPNASTASIIHRFFGHQSKNKIFQRCVTPHKIEIKLK